jgi:hypothetical protein
MNATLSDWMHDGYHGLWLSAILLGGAGVVAYFSAKSEAGFDGSTGKKIALCLIGCWCVAVFFGVLMQPGWKTVREVPESYIGKFHWLEDQRTSGQLDAYDTLEFRKREVNSYHVWLVPERVMVYRGGGGILWIEKDYISRLIRQEESGLYAYETGKRSPFWWLTSGIDWPEESIPQLFSRTPQVRKR